MDTAKIPSAGDVFVGSWRIEKQVGKGGFSVVYRAVDETGRVAALKVLLPEIDEHGNIVEYDEDLVERFLREARLLGTLDNPYTIRMYDYGESDAGLLYMIFEFIDGRSLFNEIKQQGALDPDRVIHILRQTLIGLQSAHKLGILHRDIKPNNIMLFERDDDPDRVKLVDFGIAKMYGDAKELPGNDLTAAGLLVGTPRYMSPEQLRGDALSPPSDVYSMGLCAVEMLTGRKCISGKDRIKIVQKQLLPEPVRLPPSVDAPAGLKQVVHRMVEKDLQKRYASATDALKALEALVGDPGATGDTVFETVPSSLDVSAEKPKTEETETVLHRVDAAELDSLIAQQDAASAQPDDQTVPVSGPPADPTRGSGMHPPPGGPPRGASASNSGLNASAPSPQPPANRSNSGMNAFGTGQQPPANRSNSGMNAYGSGQHPTADRSDESLHSAQTQPTDDSASALPTDVGDTNPFDREQPPPDSPLAQQSAQNLPTVQRTLDSSEKMALIASFILPGVGHLMLGQMVKGIGALVLLLITAGIGWVLLGPGATVDAFLVIRARKRRTVDDLEFFPDLGDLL